MVAKCSAAVLLLALSADAAAAKPAPVTSWGKAGVDFATYRRDATECATIGYFTDVKDTEPAKRFVQAAGVLDRALNLDGIRPDEYVLAQRRLRPNRRIAEVGVYLHGVVADCLRQRGYSEFTLSNTQTKALSRLEKGSPERHAFMHRLSSDGTIVRRQAIIRRQVVVVGETE